MTKRQCCCLGILFSDGLLLLGYKDDNENTQYSAVIMALQNGFIKLI